MNLLDKYLINENDQRKIKDLATALASEIEVSIEKIINDWSDHNELEFNDGTKLDESEVVKLIQMAIKKIKIRHMDI